MIMPSPKFIFSLFLFTVLSGVYPATAQDDKKALTILDAMSKRYQALSSYKVAFTYAAAGGRPAKGEATVKGDKFRLKMADQEILNDGKVMATFLKESNEVTLQQYDPEEIGDLSPARIYLAYKKGYKNTYTGETKSNGRAYDNVRLTPAKNNSQVSRIELMIDKEDKSIKGWKIFAKGNETTGFEVTDFKTNPAVSDSEFVFNSRNFPGAEVVDLR